MKELSMRILDNDKVWDFVRKNENPLMMSGHIGTHIDVYNKTLIPENYIERRTITIDCRNYDLNREIGIEILEDYKIIEGDFVIFFTDIQKENGYGSEIYIKNHYQLSWELINELLKRKVSFIGIDCAGIRRGEEHIITDKKCEDNQTYVIENLDSNALKDMNSIEETLIIWYRIPLMTGLPVRIFKKEK